MAYATITTSFVRIENFNNIFFLFHAQCILYAKELSVSLVKGGNWVC